MVYDNVGRCEAWAHGSDMVTAFIKLVGDAMDVATEVA
jgi:hypothetical protein